MDKIYTVERWRCAELSFTGSQNGNPFTDCSIHGALRGEHETVSTNGFFDGKGIYRIRFYAVFSGGGHTSKNFLIDAITVSKS